MNQTLLIELLTEELPPKVLNQLGNHFAQSIADALLAAELTHGSPDYTAYASPRRLAVQIRHVAAVQNDRTILKKGPAVAHAVKNGEPTAALLGFARSCGVSIDQLKIIHDGKQEVYAHEFIQSGLPLEQLLADIVSQAIKKLPIPKVMRWGSSTHTFVRPVHGLVMLYGNQVVSGSVLGLQSSNRTLGHRFLSEGEIVLRHADEYAEQLRTQGRVVASFAERQQVIKTALTQQAEQLNAQLAADQSLLDEVTALVEWPVILKAEFESHFLAIPQECLILTMQQNQKYFPLLDKNGKLINHFLLVSNLATQDSSYIIHGNERVLRARLSDAEFFYQQDQKHTLESRLPRLEQVVYQNKLGSQAQRVQRLIQISTLIAEKLLIDTDTVKRAAQLAKADLLTEMVGEFPELQGVMGRYYAELDGENPLVAEAIEQHYRPRFAGDALPENPVAITISLADKLEMLVGIWGVGLVPTGDKDPYALRRAALGVIRILMHYPLHIDELLQMAFSTFDQGKLSQDTVPQLLDFIFTRLAILLHNQYSSDIVAAVLAKQPRTFNDIQAKLSAVAQFKQLPEAIVLGAANKRVHNLLKKAESFSAHVDESRLLLPQEQALYQATQSLASTMQISLANGNYAEALTALAVIKPQVDEFFDSVMVMVDDILVRNNRLNLLYMLSLQLNAVADISLLTE